MRKDLAEVAARLSTQSNPMAGAAAIIQEIMEGQPAHVS
jgi:hypothetical protein